jgi:hypothetical protein
MPYLGAPFFPEGNPQALLDTLQRLRELRPTQLIHGHAPLTATFTVDCLDGLHHALTDLTTMVLDAIHAGAGLAAILHRNHLPESLREHPAAVMPYLITRDNFTSRLHHQHTGYWKPDGQGIHTFSAHERAAALNLVANGQVERFYNAADVLLTEGHAALALETLDSGLLAHPQDPNLVALRQTVLLRLMERHQQFDPFRFLIYTERSGTELAPVQ